MRLRGQLTADVKKVMLHLVECVDCHPTEGPLDRLRVRVHQRALPVGGTETRQCVGEQHRRIVELAEDVGAVLFRVPVMVDPLITTHRLEVRALGASGQEDALPLHEEDVAKVAGVFEGGPGLRLAPSSDVDVLVAHRLDELRHLGEDRGRRFGRLPDVVDEPALIATVQPPDTTDPRFRRAAA